MVETPEFRRRVMQAVKGKNTKPELAVRKLLQALGHRYYRLHYKSLAGNPDIVFVSRRKAIFVHGCFWHGHNCSRGSRQPKTNTFYWKKKIEDNRTRDSLCISQLRHTGWSILTVWECQIRNVVKLKRRLFIFLEPKSIP